MEEVQGIPVGQAPEGPARREAARQLLESYYRQILTDGFFHADPHPGNLMWWNDGIYFLDFGMVGEIGPDVRESMMLFLTAFWQEDVSFLMLSGGIGRADRDVARFRGELGDLMAKYRTVSLRDIQLGPILQEMTELDSPRGAAPGLVDVDRKGDGPDAATASELDPELDPFEMAGSYHQADRGFRAGGGVEARREASGELPGGKPRERRPSCGASPVSGGNGERGAAGSVPVGGTPAAIGSGGDGCPRRRSRSSVAPRSRQARHVAAPADRPVGVGPRDRPA
jgi:hypothetical protein